MKLNKPLILSSALLLFSSLNLYSQSTGNILEDGAIYSGFRKATVSRSSIPNSVDLSTGFPAPGDQGGQGSCVGWACAYALKSFHEQQESSWGLHTNAHIFSPAYLYNQINSGVDKGSRIPDALNLLQREGVATWSSFPYKDWDHESQPSRAVKNSAQPFRISTFYTLDRRAFKKPYELKKILASGYPLIISIRVDGAFSNYQYGVFNRSMGTASSTHGNHAVCITGYGNSPDHFRLINSWGTNWGEKGFMRIDSNCLVNRLNSVYYAIDKTGTGAPTVDPANPWMFNSQHRKILATELGYLSVEELWRARNEIYARRGYVFQTHRGKAYAAALGRAYSGRFNSGTVEAQFSDIEWYNISQIAAIEHGRPDSIGNLPPNPWVFPDSNVRRLSKFEVSTKSKDQLWRARNEIFARRGYQFQTEKGKQFGRSLGRLYTPWSGDMNAIYQTFNALEKFNVDLIKSYE